jgi:hypothetical protein
MTMMTRGVVAYLLLTFGLATCSIRAGAWDVLTEVRTLSCRKNIHDRTYLYTGVTSGIGAGLCRAPGRVFPGLAG